MKHGICVRYSYSGDEAHWARVVGDFVAAVAADSDLAGRFSYHVQTARDGRARIHIGRWDLPETVQLMQSKAYFPPFAAALKALAGDTLTTEPFDVTFSATP